jgi:GTP-binding protein
MAMCRLNLLFAEKSGVDKLRQKLDSWFNEIPPQEAVEDAE